MSVNNDVPDKSKDKPGEIERCSKAEQSPRPREVNHRCKKVFQEPKYILLQLSDQLVMLPVTLVDLLRSSEGIDPSVF